MLTSTCRNCGQSKSPTEYANPYCGTCTTTANEAAQHFAAENPNASESDALYAGRMAMGQRAIRPGSNYVDPRTFSAGRREIPKPGA